MYNLYIRYKMTPVYVYVKNERFVLILRSQVSIRPFWRPDSSV